MDKDYTGMKEYIANGGTSVLSAREPTVNVRFLITHSQKEGWKPKEISVSYNDLSLDSVIIPSMSGIGQDVYDEAARAADYANEQETNNHAI